MKLKSIYDKLKIKSTQDINATISNKNILKVDLYVRQECNVLQN